MHVADVLIGIGGIAAYKVCEVVSTLLKLGLGDPYHFSPKFITPLTLATLSRHPAYTDEMFCSRHTSVHCIYMGEWAEVFAIVPHCQHPSKVNPRHG